MSPIDAVPVTHVSDGSESDRNRAQREGNTKPCVQNLLNK